MPRLIIEIESGYVVEREESEDELKHPLKLETDCYHSLSEVVKCIMQSGFIVRAYKMFDGTD